MLQAVKMKQMVSAVVRDEEANLGRFVPKEIPDCENKLGKQKDENGKDRAQSLKKKNLIE